MSVTAYIKSKNQGHYGYNEQSESYRHFLTPFIPATPGVTGRKFRTGDMNNKSVVNERAYVYSGGDDRNKPRLLLLKRLLMRRLSLSCLITLLKWVNEEASNDKYYADNTQAHSQRKREFFEEIACQTNGKNGYSQIEYCPGDKLSACFINNSIHYDNFYHILRICQGENSRQHPGVAVGLA